MVQSDEENHKSRQLDGLILSKDVDGKKNQYVAKDDGKGKAEDTRIVFESNSGTAVDLVPQDVNSSEEGQDGVEKEEEKKKVPDGGYGWFVVLGCFLAHIIIGGFERTDGVFFLQFRSRFGKSAQLTAWPGAISSGLRLSLGPVVSAICNRFSVRSSVLVGSLLVTVAHLLTANTPEFFFLFFSHAVVQGIGCGLMYTPGLIIVNMYFDKHRGLALGLGSAGVGVGTFCIVPLVQYLFDTIGFWGTFLITAGIALNGVLVAMLYRPLSLHHKFTTKKRAKHAESARTEEGMHLTSSKEEESQSPNSTQMFKEYQHPEAPAKHDGCLKSSLKIFFPVEHQRKGGAEKKKLFHFALLKDPSFLMFCISIFLFTAAFKAAFTFIPALVESKGLSHSEAAIVLSITGVFDTAGRIAAGFLLDRPLCRPLRPVIYNSLIFGIATISFVIPSLTSFPLFCVLCSVYGSLTGAYVSQKSVVIVDILGIENMATAFGILVGFQAIGTFIGPPSAGALRDAFGGFKEAFYLGGSFMVVAGLLMVASNIFLRIKRRKQSELKTLNT